MASNLAGPSDKDIPAIRIPVLAVCVAVFVIGAVWCDPEWIAAAAYSKYGHPEEDQVLLEVDHV